MSDNPTTKREIGGSMGGILVGISFVLVFSLGFIVGEIFCTWMVCDEFGIKYGFNSSWNTIFFPLINFKCSFLVIVLFHIIALMNL